MRIGSIQQPQFSDPFGPSKEIATQELRDALLELIHDPTNSDAINKVTEKIKLKCFSPAFQQEVTQALNSGDVDKIKDLLIKLLPDKVDPRLKARLNDEISQGKIDVFVDLYKEIMDVYGPH